MGTAGGVKYISKKTTRILQQKQFVIRGEPVILPLNSELLLDLSDAIDPPRERERKRV